MPFFWWLGDPLTKERLGWILEQLAGMKVAPPWTMDITPLVKPGANRIEVLVCNTLANHYTTVVCLAA